VISYRSVFRSPAPVAAAFHSIYLDNDIDLAVHVMAASASRISIAKSPDGEKAHIIFENSALLKKHLHGERIKLPFP
jgi:hypothetical protein